MQKISEIIKEASDSRLDNDIKNNQGLFLLNYSGASSADLTVLRRDLKKYGARMFVTKNSFIDIALKKSDKEKEVLDMMAGPTALIFVSDDPVAPSKVLTDFAKSHETIKLSGGYIKNRLLKTEDFKVLASIPPKEVLYQQIACALNGPLSKFALSLNQIVAKLAYALKALSDKKEKEK